MTPPLVEMGAPPALPTIRPRERPAETIRERLSGAHGSALTTPGALVLGLPAEANEARRTRTDYEVNDLVKALLS
jgi:hypothetical protein